MGWVMAKAIALSLICVLCLLPALAISTYHWIDKTQHRPIFPDFRKASGFIMKCRLPVFFIVAVLVVPCIIAQGKMIFFMVRAGSTAPTRRRWTDLLAVEEEYGVSNPVVVMVPKGEIQKEIAMNEEFKKEDCVDSVISYVNTAGASIPTDFVPDEEVSKLYSEHYSRFILSLNVEEGKAGWDDSLNKIRSISEKYYGKDALIAGDLASTLDLKPLLRRTICE